MTQVRRAPLADQAAELLMERISAGEWGIGAKLPGETTLAPQLGVGRSTIREAIRQLAGRGVLTTRQGAGVFVAALEDPERLDALLRRADIASVLEARVAIEVEAAALAAARRTAAELRAMRAAAAERAAHRGGIDELVAADTAFHRSIVVAAHNAILLELFDSLAPRIVRAMADMLQLNGEHGGDDDQAIHERILQVIADREPEQARALTREHLLALRLGIAGS